MQCFSCPMILINFLSYYCYSYFDSYNVLHHERVLILYSSRVNSVIKREQIINNMKCIFFLPLFSTPRILITNMRNIPKILHTKIVANILQLMVRNYFNLNVILSKRKISRTWKRKSCDFSILLNFLYSLYFFNFSFNC